MTKLFNGIQIQTIAGCNLKCKFCPNSYLPQTMNLMSKDLYYKIIDELAELGYSKRVSPYLMNESLLDKRLGELISYTRKKLSKARIMVSTNGTLLTKKVANELIKRGMNDFIVSCYSKEVYKKVINFGMREIEAIAFYTMDLSKKYYNRGGNVRVGPKCPIIKPCFRPMKQMYIDASGKAVICCSDYKKEVVMGDVNKERLVDIWNNKKYEEYRMYLKIGQRQGLKLCETCNY